MWDAAAKQAVKLPEPTILSGWDLCAHEEGGSNSQIPPFNERVLLTEMPHHFRVCVCVSSGFRKRHLPSKCLGFSAVK